MAVTVEFTGDEKKLFEAMKRLEAKGIDVVRALKQIETAGQQAAKEATRVFDQTRTPVEKYNQRLEQLNRLLKEGAINQQTYARAVDQANAKLRQTESSGAAAFGQGMLSNVMALVGGYMSVQGALALINRELEYKAELDKKALTTQTSIQSSRATIVRNLPGESAERLRDIFSQTAKIASETGVSQVEINKAFANAFSAEGTGDVKGSMEAVAAAARSLPDEPGSIAEYAGSLLDISKVTGTKDAAVNAGYISAVGAYTRITDPSLSARNVPKALIGVNKFGGDAQSSAKLFSALTVAGADVRGEESGTAAIRLAEQLREFLPKEKDLGARLKRLQEDPRLAKRFLDKASFEVKMKGPIESFLLDPQSQARKTYAAANIPTGDAAADVFRQQLAMYHTADATQPAVSASRQIKTALEAYQSKDLLSSRSAVSREAVQASSEALRLPSFAAGLVEKNFDMRTWLGQEPTTEAIRIMREGQKGRSPEQVALLQKFEALLMEVQKANSPETLKDLLNEVKGMRADAKRTPVVQPIHE